MSSRFNIHAMQGHRAVGGAFAPTAFQPSLFKARADEELLTPFSFKDFLGVSSVALADRQGVLNGDMLAIRVQLSPGDVLYVPGAPCQYVYIVESGLLQCVRQYGRAVVGGGAAAVSYVGSKDMIGLHELLEQRQDEVVAVSHASLLALPIAEVRAIEGASALMAESLSRHVSAALKRNWRMVYVLRELSAGPRILMALANLIHLAYPGRQGESCDGPVKVHLDLSMFRAWVGLPVRDLMSCLAQLKSDKVLNYVESRIVELNPRLLLSLSGKAKGVRADKPAVELIRSGLEQHEPE